MTPSKTDKSDERPDSVAAVADNKALEHTAGGQTTRDDATDLGVTMLPGRPDEPIGPEDALGPGPKRGEYSGRVDAGPHVVMEPIPESERDVVELKDDDGNVIGLERGPSVRAVDAGARASEQGDEPGKGGVPGARRVG
jgi:hypothetical protein